MISAVVALVVTGWVSTGSMATPRSGHTATLVPDGRVLVVGGLNGTALASCEWYEPATGQFSPAPVLPEARSSHSALLLSDGRVLVVGGTNSMGALRTALVLTPDAGGWVGVASQMSEARAGATVVQLAECWWAPAGPASARAR